MPRIRAVPLVLAVAAGVLAVPIGQVPGPAGAETDPGRVVVASANLYEGALVRAPRDLADSSDVRRFVQRLGALSPEAPDVVALQEVRGSLGSVVRRLNTAMRGRATYAAITRPSLARTRGECGDRRGRFTVVRDGALVVNTATTTVLERGAMRTWGRWWPTMRPVLGRPDAAGCAEHPWARVRVVHEGIGRDIVVVGTHLGPLGHHLKTGAMRALGDAARALTGTGDLVVLAGDFNLPWCGNGRRTTGSAACRTAAGHEELVARGFGDALRDTGGDAGTRGRVDFIHTSGEVVTAAWDRCYRPRHSPGCTRGEAAFSSEQTFAACHRRSTDRGRPGGACQRRSYARYYSDHPVVTATVR